VYKAGISGLKQSVADEPPPTQIRSCSSRHDAERRPPARKHYYNIHIVAQLVLGSWGMLKSGIAPPEEIHFTADQHCK